MDRLVIGMVALLFSIVATPAYAKFYNLSPFGLHVIDETTPSADFVADVISSLPVPPLAFDYGPAGMVVALSDATVAIVDRHSGGPVTAMPFPVVTPAAGTWLAGFPGGALTALEYGPGGLLYGIYDDGSGGWLVLVAPASAFVGPQIRTTLNLHYPGAQ